MKYTFTNAEGKQQTVVVPDDYIRNAKRAYGLSNKEAIDMYLSDEGYIVDPVVEELTAKAKAKKVGAESGRKSSPRRKEDPTKRAVIAFLFDSVSRETFNGAVVENVAVRNPERIISFTLGNDTYEITLSKKRK